MKQFIATMAAVGALCAPMAAFAQPDVKPHTLDAMGCMKLGECTDGVTQIKTGEDILKYFKDARFGEHMQEITIILESLKEIGVKVYIATDENFPSSHRGSYYTDTNTFYLNAGYVYDPETFMTVLRHEGWHAAQDCMAGTIDNTHIAVIMHPDLIPNEYKVSAEVRYGILMPAAIPWEQEAIWAGNTPGMTSNALNACAAGSMWEEYTPTALTQEWLEEKGFM